MLFILIYLQLVKIIFPIKILMTKLNNYALGSIINLMQIFKRWFFFSESEGRSRRRIFHMCYKFCTRDYRTRDYLMSCRRVKKQSKSINKWLVIFVCILISCVLQCIQIMATQLIVFVQICVLNAVFHTAIGL